MEKPKRWQFWLIISVALLTVYNILPTVFFYAKPLKQPIQESQATQIASQISERVNALEEEAISWLESFCKLLNIKPISIALDPQNPQLVTLSFKNSAEAAALRKYLPRAGNLISFVPAQLGLYDADPANKTVVVQRRIPVHFHQHDLSSYFQFASKRTAQGEPTPLYQGLVSDRVIELAVTLAGSSENGQFVQAAIQTPNDPQVQDLLFMLAQNILSFVKTFDPSSAVAQRYFSSFSQVEGGGSSSFIDQFIASLEHAKDQVRLEKIALTKGENSPADVMAVQRLEMLQNREAVLSSALNVVQKNRSAFAAGHTPWNFSTAGSALRESGGAVQTISLQGNNPFIEKISLDWSNEKISLLLYPDILAAKEQTASDQIDQLIYNEIAAASRQSGETIKPFQGQFEIELSHLPDSQSFLALRLSSFAQNLMKQIGQTVLVNWAPKHPDLQKGVFPVWDEETYQKLPADEKKLGLLLYAPANYSKMPPKGMKMNSIYVIAKGFGKILQRLESNPNSEAAEQFMSDFNELKELLQKNGFFGYLGRSYSLSPEFSGDFIFENEDYFQPILKATREDFTVHGTKRYAVLEFSNLEQRILTDNKIGNRIHEDLLKWRDDYRAAQVDIHGTTKYDVPAPTQNALLSNFKLSCVKYFRGDDRKILHWGLDMSGGKTVQIELRDSSGRVVANEADLRQGINELYNRVNKMGVSEVNIRQEGNSIALDFPGSQSLSASELVKASSMYFHIVNEKFMTNPSLAEAANRFLQEVWNEAAVTNRKDAEEINAIAWRHLHGDSLDLDTFQPRSQAAKTLYENGLRLAAPQETDVSALLDETYSKIGVIRGNDYTEWYGQTHPLMIVFRNYVLEGSNLENVRAAYDPSKGNFLTFGVKGSQMTKDGARISPRDDLEGWTSQFAKEKIAGTTLEGYSKGRGWRMAVVLNGTIITAPTLESHLRDSASITGSFTQREVNQLEADLKAGSLSFTPRILSEKNVSPELGSQERIHGIVATVLALFLVIATMVAYYRFSGAIASIAVLFNLLIMWAAFQNIGVTLSLAGIAGIILTVAMAVDANVLVFERIREEFSVTGRIALAVHAGYRKAFSAIIDSNVTTIIAALILLHFDSGPIRGFALTLIIGIVSSLFSALFLTRFFFSQWVQNPNHKELKMTNLIRASSFNFLKWTKPTIVVSAIVIAIGCFLLAAGRHTILGMDFTGGYALSIELPVQKEGNYRQIVEKALIDQGVSAQDFQIRELNPSNNVRIFLSSSLEESGKPFSNLSQQDEKKDISYGYENNPRIAWIVAALQKSHLELTPQALDALDQNWTAISGQMSDSMRTNAVIGVAIALLCILAYITVRFEFKYAISATLCLVHDVIFSIGAIAILNWLGVSIQIDLHTVAALTMIVGYSLNDTIIVFDRIREDLRLMRKSSFSEVINHALNVTLSRTLMTSGITLLVLIPLIALGGSTLFGFALVMAIGVVFGTLSSLFIAAPLMQFFHKREDEKHRGVAVIE